MKIIDLRKEKVRRSRRKHLADAGWALGHAETEVDLELGPCLYLCEVPTGYFLMAQPLQKTYRVAEAQRDAATPPFVAVCDALGSLLGELAHGKLPSTQENQKHLGQFAVAYITRTQTYQVGAAYPHPNFLIVSYPDQETEENWLRPMLLSADRVLSPDEVTEQVNRILIIDRSRHPERFNKAQILEFRPRGASS